MKFFHRVAGGLLFLLVVAVGGGLGQAALRGGETWSVWLEIAETHPYWIAAGGLGAVLIALLWALSFFPRDRRHRYLSFENPGGEVEIRLEAIRDYLMRTHADFPGVLRVMPEVFARRGELTVVMGCEVRAGSSIPDLAQHVQERIRERIVTGIGITAIRSIRVVVRQIAEGESRLPVKKTSEETPAAALFPETAGTTPFAPESGEEDEGRDTP